jgi:hypothetical protein
MPVWHRVVHSFLQLNLCKRAHNSLLLPESICELFSAFEA